MASKWVLNISIYKQQQKKKKKRKKTANQTQQAFQSYQNAEKKIFFKEFVLMKKK